MFRFVPETTTNKMKKGGVTCVMDGVRCGAFDAPITIVVIDLIIIRCASAPFKLAIACVNASIIDEMN